MTTTKKLDELEKNKKAAAADAVSGGGALPVTGYKAPASQNQSAAGEQNPRVTALRQYLENTVGGTPTESDLLKNVRAKLMNRTGFTYDHNNDPRFKQFFETAKRSGKMAMQDTMGQAASLTGGYANSWAQTAGQTAYNSYLQDANEMIPEFEQLARARYDAETAALTDKYAILKNEHDEALAEYNSKYDIAREDWYKEQERQTAEKQYEDEKKQREIELLLAMGDYNALDRMGYNTSSLRAQAAAEATVDEDEDGVNLYDYNYNDGKVSYFTDSKGNTHKEQYGQNPYTSSRNYDGEKINPKTGKEYGYCRNGYQPKCVSVANDKGKIEYRSIKINDGGAQDYINGKKQSIWVDEKGYCWMWNGYENAYEPYTENGKQLKEEDL